MPEQLNGWQLILDGEAATIVLEIPKRDLPFVLGLGLILAAIR
jgi:hypothetical protein